MSFNLIRLIFIISFTKGLFELLGIKETLIQLTIEGLILLLVFISLTNIVKTKKIIAPAFLIISAFFLITVISYLVTEVSSLQFILYFRRLFIYIMFFYALYNLALTLEQKNKLISLIIFLFLIQIPAALVKLIVLGGTLEKIVGTMSIMEGSLATIMPLFAIVFLISHYLEYKYMKYMIFILLFIGIGLMSNKLGILFYVIGLFAILSYVYAKVEYFLPNFKFIKNIFINSIYVVIIFSLFVTLNPRANPEHKIGGSIDIEYLQKFTKDYQTLDLKSGVEGDGRFDAPFVAFDRLYNKGLINVFFGFGPGDIIESSFTKYKNPLLEKHNIGYGGRLGIVWIIMQVGIIGLFIFSYFHFYFFKEMIKIYKYNILNIQENVLLLTVIGFSFIFFIDFFTYSSSTMLSTGVTLTYYFSIYYIFSEYRNRYLDYKGR